MQSADHRVSLLTAMRFLGGLAVLAVGAVHLQQYVAADYRAIPTIGPLFLLNGIGSGIVGFLLVSPFDRKLTPRQTDLSMSLLALSAVAIAAGSLIALFISESGSLFGFSEHGYRAAIVAAIAAEGATILLLAPVAAAHLRGLFGGGGSTAGHAAPSGGPAI